MGDSVNTSCSTFQPAALRQSDEHGIEDASVASLFRGQQAVILFGDCEQFIHAGTRHITSMIFAQSNVNIIP
jgi:hypothetical protein